MAFEAQAPGSRLGSGLTDAVGALCRYRRRLVKGRSGVRPDEPCEIRFDRMQIWQLLAG